MFLEKIEIVGFKSFAKKTVLEFTKNGGSTRGITAIVGPNGSGKSNVAESIRWVLGEQGMKSLRSKRAEDVIFSGSEVASRLSIAEVSLYLNNEDRSAPVDYSEIVLTRKVNRDGTGEYYINRNQVRLADVHYLVSQCSIGQGSYAVIGQGMVDEILSSSPAERIRFFEEAAGIRPLQLRLDESLRKLIQTEENLKTVEIQLSELSPRMRSLARQVERLEKHQHILDELTSHQIEYFGWQLHQLHEERKQYAGGFEELEVSRSKEEGLVQQYQSELLGMMRQGAESNAAVELQREYQELAQERGRLREKELTEKNKLLRDVRKSITSVPVALYKGFLSSVQSRVTRIESILNESVTLEEQTQSIKEVVNDVRQIIAEHEGHVTEEKPSGAEEELRRLGEAIVRVDEKMEKLSRAIEDSLEFERKGKTKLWQMQNALKDQQRRLNEVVEALNSRKVQLARIDVRIEDVTQAANQEIRGGVGAVNESYHYREIDVDSTVKRIAALKREIELTGGIDPEVKTEFEQTKTRFDFLETESGDLRRAMDDLKNVIHDLDTQMKRQFDRSFKEIAEQFQIYVKGLFGGGKARLDLLERNDKPTESDTEEDSPEKSVVPMVKRTYNYAGVEIEAMPPGKKVQSVSMLSGGERALTSIALICAIIASHPSPFVVLDEVDAALDEANSLRLAEILESLSHKTQFVVITHNRATMERSQILYGVTMGEDGISKVVGLKLEEAVKHTNR